MTTHAENGRSLLADAEKVGIPLEGVIIGREVSEETRRHLKEVEANIRQAEEKSGSMIAG